ncbi:MAG: hypothetical protein GOV02_03225 [Candidatus Aenigmarchaeota archaeon]|nr:hypothetical protein [Candidatus Aenigmarchaeota archaeon]
MVMVVEKQKNVPEMYRLPHIIGVSISGVDKKDIEEKDMGTVARYMVDMIEDKFEPDCPQTVRKNKNGMITEVYDPELHLLITRTITDNTFYVDKLTEKEYENYNNQ